MTTTTQNNISDEQWNGIQKTMEGFFGSVKFEWNGLEISASRVIVAEGQTAIAVYIDGTIKPVWGICEMDEFRVETKILWHKRTRGKFSKKFVTDIIKIYGKRRALKEFPDIHNKITHWSCEFKKSSVFVTQYKKIDGLKLLPLLEQI